MEQPYLVPVLYCEYHVNWRPGDLSHQDINMHNIDSQSHYILSLGQEELF